ncbi:MAG TPA: peptidase U32 family protein [bacterium]|nr:peptidase U32 family protein [bacterium]HPS31197.1 peptidase U32 family protein [bacterium]
MTELLSPAGSFESAIAAFNGGADAVYLGLSDFSARKAARNFSRDELLRLKSAAVEQGKKIFVTLNTVIKESEFLQVLETAAFLNEIEIDAVILQDIGFASALHEMFPELILHASTQMAVHTVEGVENIKRIGFKRVVLSREVPLEKIIEIKKAVPDMEIEVFIHGALCYSFSGLCLASGMILGRSGNRGECAQLCRSYYEMDGVDGYYFSCNDLALKDRVKLLVEAGVDSLKIEGRMKSPQYVSNTAKLYREILDGRDFSESHQKSRICFGRSETTGYFNSFSGVELVGNRYPGHRGIKIGKCEKVEHGRFLIKTNHRIGIRDGIMFFRNGNEKDPANCSIEELFSPSGKNLFVVASGERVFIKTEFLPQTGDEVYLTSSRELDMKKVNPGSFPLWKKKIDLKISLEDNLLKIVSDDFEFCENTVTEKSENELSFINKFEQIMISSGDFKYCAGSVKFDRNCENIFIQPAVLKKIRTRFYEEYSRSVQDKIQKAIDSFMNTDTPEPPEISEIFKNRAQLSPHSEISFVMENDDLNTVIPLVPVMKNSFGYLNKVAEFIKENPEKKFLVGISNIGHFGLADMLKKSNNVEFFIDFPIYIANRFTWSYLKKVIGERLIFGYHWIEDRASSQLDNFNPPLFISAGCFEKANNLNSCINCSKTFPARKLTNMGRNFKVVTKNCLTFVFKEVL